MRIDVQGDGTVVRRVILGSDRSPGQEPADVLIDVEGAASLLVALEEAEADPRCRIIVLEGRAPVFCRGMDLNQVVSNPGLDLSEGVRLFARCLAALLSSGRIVVSVVDGEATGGGVGLAAAADICVATARSTFALPELVLGLLPAVVLPVLQERMPPQKARMLCLSSSVSAKQAHGWGLVDQLVEDPARLEKTVRAVIKHGLRCSPQAVAGLKDLQGRMRDLGLAEALEVGARRTAGIIGDQDALEAIRAFLGGDSMPWFDRYRPEESAS
ncbi:MAG: enoyl-CoA hydratase/isomerase family protein [Pseudomonadota bacterium]